MDCIGGCQSIMMDADRSEVFKKKKEKKRKEEERKLTPARLATQRISNSQTNGTDRTAP